MLIKMNYINQYASLLASNIFILIFVIVGILGGLWPCGIFVVAAELYVAESNSQVYAILHETLRSYNKSFKDLSKYFPLYQL